MCDMLQTSSDTLFFLSWKLWSLSWHFKPPFPMCQVIGVASTWEHLEFFFFVLARRRGECVHIVQVPFYFMMFLQFCSVRTGKCFALRQLSDEPVGTAGESQRVEQDGQQQPANECHFVFKKRVHLIVTVVGCSGLWALVWKRGETTLALSLSTWENG